MKAVLKVQRVIVLKSLPGRITARLASARRCSSDKFIETSERQFAAIPAIKKSINECAAKFVTELPVMPAGSVAHVAKELSVSVDAAARDRSVGAQSSKSINADLWQAK